MNVIKSIFVLVFATLVKVFGREPIEVIFLIRSQEVQPHNQLSKHLKENLSRQALWLQTDYNVKVHILHELFNFPGDWTVLHAIPHLLAVSLDADEHADDVSKFITNNTQWIVLCDDTTSINLQLLMHRLKDENHTQPLFLGHALYDQEPTIIHHFAFAKNPKWFPYPMLSAGIVLSLPLVKSISDILGNRNNNRRDSILRSEFSIDAGHELARFIYDNVHVRVAAEPQDDFRTLRPDIAKATTFNSTQHQKMLLKKTSYICPGTASDVGRHDTECAMYAAPTPSTVTCTSISRAEVYFAIKTCSRYHKERLTIVQATWGPYAKHIKYFSDVEDDQFSTIDTGVPNVGAGHCDKTLAILKIALKDIATHNERGNNLNSDRQIKRRRIKWIFLADDDTLLSISGVCQVLGCFDATDEVYLGERYGYRLYAPDGFNYITGGGGVAFSLPMARLIVQQCSCPSSSAPDDMILGSCLHTLEVRALHSARFHQARPNDYPMERLLHEKPLSFHKFYQTDPLEVYRHWFFDDDDHLLLLEANDLDTAGRNDVYSSGETTSHISHHTNNHILEHREVKILTDLVPVSLIAALHHSKERHIDL